MLCLGLVAVVLSSAVLFPLTYRTPFHGDESGWISAGNYYCNLLSKHDFRWDHWRGSSCGYWGSLQNLQLGKVLIGFPLNSPWSSASSQPVFFAFYDFDKSFDINVSDGSVPSQNILVAARLQSAAFGVLCCLLISSLAYLTNGFVAGAAATILLIMNPLFCTFSTRAMSDVHYNFFLLALTLALLPLIKGKDANLPGYSCLCGVLAGLACSVKVTGIVLGSCYFLAVLIYRMWLQPFGYKLPIKSLVAFTLSSMMTVYFLNPFFWISTEVFNLPALGQEVSLAISDAARTPPIDFLQTRELYPQIENLSHPLEFVQVVLFWNDFLKQLETSPSAQFHGNRLIVLQQELFSTHSSFPFEWLLLLAGICGCLLETIRSALAHRLNSMAVPVVFFMTNYFCLVFFVHINWDRYYLPAEIATQAVCAIGLGSLARLLLSLLHRQTKFRTE